ncbi:MAG: extracellular solute-binding protein [Candidatus Planktophila sp.]|nr:extracellular solute-binding protein [Candidatus Planktophila sp.]
MNTKRFGFAGVIAAAALAVSTLVAPSASAATEIVVWADESRGPNLTKVIAAKGDWVPGYTIKIVTFSSFDALKEAFDKATDASGPDVVVAANDWVPSGAKSGKLAPIVLTAAVKARFNQTQFLDLTYKGKLYGVPVDINNVAMIYNTKLVSSAPTSFGEMVNYYKANKASKGLKAGLCIAGGGMSWGAHSVFSALGANAYQFNSRNKIVYGRTFSAVTFGKNVRTYLLDGKKSNGFFPATDTGCKDNFLAGTVPFAVIGNWEWKDYVAKGFTMNLMPVPGVVAGTYGHMFGSVSGALLTTFAEKHGVEAGAKSLLTNFFASTDGQVRYQALELRPPAEKGAQADASVSAGQRGFGSAASLAGIPQIGAFLNSNKGGANYWDSAPAYWTAVLIDGKNAVSEASKLAAIWRANVEAGKGDL